MHLSRRDNSIRSALADDELVRILNSCAHLERSATEIIQENKIPHATAYRKINWLLQEGLLISSRIEVTQDGKKFSMFRSIVKSAAIRYENSGISVDAEYNSDLVDRIATKFLSV